jgi:hypothetical protein
MQNAQRLKAHSIRAALAVCLKAYPDTNLFWIPTIWDEPSSFWNGNVIDTAAAPHRE